MNCYSVIANLTTDPKESETSNGNAIARFRIAINTAKDKAIFMSCTAFGYTAENILKYLSKGSKVALVGALKPNDWTDKSGKEHRDIELNVNTATFISNWKADSVPNKSSENNETSQDDDDLPF